MVLSRRKRKAQTLDPHREREARKYPNPIPSREFILQVLAEAGVPLTFEQLGHALTLGATEDLIALERRVAAMERDGQLVRNRRGALCLVNKRDLVAGRVIGHPDGFGFVKPDVGEEDIFLSPREMRAVFHGDRVVVRVTGQDRRGRLESEVVEILERNTPKVVGRLYQESGVGFVVPDNPRLSHDIIVPRDFLGSARQGQIVVAEVIEPPTKRTQPIGRILEVLGDRMTPGMETDIALRAHNLPVTWPEAVEAEIAGMGSEVEESAKTGRQDLRKLPLVTIDGANARDFDDAVFCESRPKGWRLLVCIADVSHYVRSKSALDLEALNRGNSVYFPDRVIPMLPEVLSNGLCSLNPEVDRLCMACELSINRAGEITRSRFFPAVMRSHARLTYEQVAAMLIEGDSQLCARYAPLLPHLHQLYALYQVLLAARLNRGAIDLDTIETEFDFDAAGKIREIRPLVRNEAHRIIEECMLAANLATARLLERKHIPTLYRIHQGPPKEKLAELREFLGELGLELAGGDKPQARDYARLLGEIRGRPDQALVQMVLLRSMSQASYSADNTGHFGLAYPAYTHFTSPIRRYPDLLVHRAIRHVLAGGKGEDFEYAKPKVQVMGEHCSGTERRADEATRDAENWLKCEYMLDKIGEELSGWISGVTSFGLFVQLEEIYIDGLVHVTALDNDYYHFDPVGHRLTGERTGRVYRLGDPIRVRLVAVNLDERKIDFVPAQTASTREGGPRRRR